MTLVSERHRRVAVCRRAGCSAPAKDLGLCEDHSARQVALRAGVEPRPSPPSSPAPVGPAWLWELAAAREAPWRSQAACRGMTSTMYPEPERGQPVDFAPALAICAGCPVVEPCAEAGARESFGVWGGSTPKNRKQGRRA